MTRFLNNIFIKDVRVNTAYVNEKTTLYIWFHKNNFPTCAKNVRFRLKQITTDRVFSQNILSSTTPKNLSKLLKNVKSCYEKIFAIFYQKSLLSGRKYLITSHFWLKFQKIIWWNFWWKFLVKFFDENFIKEFER